MPDAAHQKADRFWSAPRACGGDRHLRFSLALRNAQKPTMARLRASLGPLAVTKSGQVLVRTLRLRRRPQSCCFAFAAECAEAKSGRARSVTRSTHCRKKRTGFGPHPCPQMRTTSQCLWGYVRSSELISSDSAFLWQKISRQCMRSQCPSGCGGTSKRIGLLTPLPPSNAGSGS